MKTYSFNRLSVNNAIPILVLTVTLVFVVPVYVANPNSTVLLTMIGLGGFLLLIIYTGFFARKIQIHEDKLVYMGINKTSEVDLKETKTVGVFLQLRNNRIPIEPEQIDKYSIFGVKFIYASTINNPNLNSKISNEFICFQYRKSAFDLIKSRTEKTPPNNG